MFLRTAKQNTTRARCYSTNQSVNCTQKFTKSTPFQLLHTRAGVQCSTPHAAYKKKKKTRFACAVSMRSDRCCFGMTVYTCYVAPPLSYAGDAALARARLLDILVCANVGRQLVAQVCLCCKWQRRCCQTGFSLTVFHQNPKA